MPNGWLNPEFNYGKDSRQWLGHSFRYHLAAGFVEPGETVGDFACGVGYGSDILARLCGSEVAALDADIKAIEIAKDRYNHPAIGYAVVDFDEIDALDKVDVAVSFETIEHLRSHPQRFASMLKAAARRLVIVSAPVVPTVGVNPHHLHDFTEESLLKLFVDEEWQLWEVVRQGVYQIQVLYRKQN